MFLGGLDGAVKRFLLVLPSLPGAVHDAPADASDSSHARAAAPDAHHNGDSASATCMHGCACMCWGGAPVPLLQVAVTGRLCCLPQPVAVYPAPTFALLVPSTVIPMNCHQPSEAAEICQDWVAGLCCWVPGSAGLCVQVRFLRPGGDGGGPARGRGAVRGVAARAGPAGDRRLGRHAALLGPPHPTCEAPHSHPSHLYLNQDSVVACTVAARDRLLGTPRCAGGTPASPPWAPLPSSPLHLCCDQNTQRGWSWRSPPGKPRCAARTPASPPWAPPLTTQDM